MEAFEAILRPDPHQHGTYIEVPREITDSWRAAGVKGAPKVVARFNGIEYRGSLMGVGDGSFCLGVLKTIREALRVPVGAALQVELELDGAPRTVEVPPDLQAALEKSPSAAAAWSRLSYTGRKEMARSIDEARRPETRIRRLEQAVSRLKA